MAQFSKVFFPYDPLPAQDLNDIVSFMNGVADGTNLEDSAKPQFDMRIVNADTSSINITDLGFRPREVQAFYMPTNQDTFAIAMNGYAVDSTPIKNYCTSITVNGSNQYRYSSTSDLLLAVNTSGTVQLRGAVTSFNSNGVTISVSVTQNTNIGLIFRG